MAAAKVGEEYVPPLPEFAGMPALPPVKLVDPAEYMGSLSTTKIECVTRRGNKARNKKPGRETQAARCQSYDLGCYKQYAFYC